ncbi:Arsenical pump-driving ATPase [Enhygromyxa salina]|uniref:arsenite-transporting ATPase n=1 Tax=Enhygromyxa salina TaxID=215803 RepID=A0A0C1ZMV5_9BACT|nr:ArsA family ATPase [Enhygromyxa salina]KIG12413.1 Arsenical pump-driving ATPase [Enhygromyxa salina]
MPELRSSDPEQLLLGLESRRLLIVSGKGGVGRTTVAALLGAALASRGRKVLVATTGHDDRLAWMLGGEQLTDTPVEVAPNLDIQRLVPATCVEEYGTLVTKSQRLSHMVFGNKAVRRLLRAIPGLDDFAILGKVWHEAVRARSYDTIVFDGPASGHLRLVLGVPQAILATVADGPLTREATAMRDSLQDPSVCAAVLVGLPEPWPLTELGELATALRREIGMGAGTLVVNKLWPLLPDLGPHTLPPEASANPAVANMLAVVNEIGERGREQREVVSAWLDGRTSLDEQLVTVPWWPWGLDQLSDIRALLAMIQAGGDAADAKP